MKKQFLFLILLGLLCSVGNVWGADVKPELPHSITASNTPAVPSASLNLSSQTDFDADGNGWIVFYTKGVVDSKSWWGKTQTNGGSTTWVAPSGTIAPFKGASSSTNRFTMNTTRVHAIRFTGAEKASFLVKNSSSSGTYRHTEISLYSYNSGSSTLSDALEVKNSGNNTEVKEIIFEDLTPSTDYVAYIYGDNSSNSDFFEVALKAPNDPVDPTIKFNDGEYNVGDAALDLSSLFSSNSSGAVTYTVTNAGSTGASIEGTSLTATAAGSATVQASQAAATGYNAKVVTATITVTNLITPTFTVTSSAEYIIGNSLTLSSLITANNSDGALSYTVKDAGTTVASITDGVFTATTAGTAIVTIAVASSATYAAASEDVTITVAANPLGTHTVTFTLTAGSSNVSGSATSVNLGSFSTAFTASNLTFDGSQSGYAKGINGTAEETEYNPSKYVDLSFTVADGYTFTPSAVSFSANPFGGTAAMKYKLALLDENYNILSDDIACAKNTDNAVTFESGVFTGKLLSGTVHVRAYFYGAASTKVVYIKSPITITGTVAVAPTKYTITYKLNGGTGTTPTEAAKWAGTEFTLHDGTTGITAPSGKEFSKWLDQDDNELAGGASYTMPAKNVTLTAQWIDEKPLYAISKGAETNGTFTIDVAEAKEGDEVTLSATPASGYQFYNWTILKTADESDVTALVSISDATSASATFEMPAYAVTVNAVFGAPLYTVTYDANLGTCATESATQASSGASLTLPTPTFAGCTFDGWYSAGVKIGDAGADYTPTADITVYAKWIDNIEGKLFSYIDGNLGDKFMAFDGSGIVSTAGTDKDKTFTDGTTGAQFIVSDGQWDEKANSISALAKFKNETTGMSIVIPSGYKATVKIMYGAYNTSNKLTVGGAQQTAPKAAFADGHSNSTIHNSDLTEVTLNNQSGTLTLGSSTGNIYIARVAVVLTHVEATVTSAGWATFSSAYALDLTDVNRPAGLTAYQVEESGVNSTAKTIAPSALNSTVAANTGLLLEGAAGTYSIPVVASGTDISSSNKMVAVLSNGTVINSADLFVLAYQGGEVVFAHTGDHSATLNKGQAYLNLSGVAHAPGMRIVLGENNATNIQNIEGNETAVKFIENGQIYIKRDGVVYDAVGRVIRK